MCNVQISLIQVIHAFVNGSFNEKFSSYTLMLPFYSVDKKHFTSCYQQKLTDVVCNAKYLHVASSIKVLLIKVI